jgi:acetylornithine deacetylase/succinyl-diaminopimelate desuccinylase-like protein
MPDPPGNEKPAADYLTQVLQQEGLTVETYALEPHRPNIVTRIKGTGKKRPLLMMGHLDVVNVDPKKWTHPPFGGVREGGRVKYASVETLEKIPRAIELTARGVAGHGSVPLKSNPIVHLAAAIARIGEWRAPIRLNETTRAYFTRLAGISPAAQASHYRDALDPAKVHAADAFFIDEEPRHSSMLRSSISPISPNIIQGGYRINVIPSEARATLDVRTLPDEDLDALLKSVRDVVNDPAITVEWGQRDVRPAGSTRLDSEAFKTIEAVTGKTYDTVTVPLMSTGATDMSYLRAKGVQCYGVGPATDVEEGPKGYGAHSDQERILESELNRFVRFQWDVVSDLAARRD